MYGLKKILIILFVVSKTVDAAASDEIFQQFIGGEWQNITRTQICGGTNDNLALSANAILLASAAVGFSALAKYGPAIYKNVILPPCYFVGDSWGYRNMVLPSSQFIYRGVFLPIYSWFPHGKISSQYLNIDEVLTPAMNEELISCLRIIHHTLDESGWKKSPIFGPFENTPMSCSDHVSYRISRKESKPDRNKDCLYGISYKYHQYSIEIKRYFNITPPNEIEDFSDFYKINETFKENDKEKPIFSDPKDTKSPINSETLLNSNNKNKAELFLKSFLEICFIKNRFDPDDSKEPSEKVKVLSKSFHNLLELYEIDDEMENDNIQLVYKRDQSNENVYFLFPTHENERERQYSIMLHFNKSKAKKELSIEETKNEVIEMEPESSFQEPRDKAKTKMSVSQGLTVNFHPSKQDLLNIIVQHCMNTEYGIKTKKVKSEKSENRYITKTKNTIKDPLKLFDFVHLEIPLRKTLDDLSIRNSPLNKKDLPKEAYIIDGKSFQCQNVSGTSLRCFFNAAGLKADAVIDQLREQHNDPIVRYMIANEITSAAENSTQLPESVKKAINYSLYKEQRKELNVRDELRSKKLSNQNPDGNQQDTEFLPEGLHSTVLNAEDDEILEELRKRATSLEAFNAFIDDHIGRNNMMVALHDVKGNVNYTSIDAAVYVNNLGLKIYQPTKEEGSLHLVHEFIPQDAIEIVYLYHQGLHFQALVPK